MEQRRYWLASQERSRSRYWLRPEVRGDYIKPQRSPRLKKHFFDYDTLTMTLDQTRCSDHWLKMVMSYVVAVGLDVGCRSLEVVVPFPWFPFLRGLPALPSYCSVLRQDEAI